MFSGFLPLIFHGLLWTAAISFSSLLIGVVLGMLLAMGQISKFKYISLGVSMFTSIFRGLPEIVVLFFFYFGGEIILAKLCGYYVSVNPFLAGVVGLSIIFASYAAQVFSSAISELSNDHSIAAKALGLSKTTIFFKIKLPQIVYFSKPGLTNLWLSLLKDSSLVSLIGLPEVMNNIGLASSQTQQPFLFYSLAALIYIFMTSVSKYILERSNQWA